MHHCSLFCLPECLGKCDSCGVISSPNESPADELVLDSEDRFHSCDSEDGVPDPRWDNGLSEN